MSRRLFFISQRSTRKLASIVEDLMLQRVHATQEEKDRINELNSMVHDLIREFKK